MKKDGLIQTNADCANTAPHSLSILRQERVMGLIDIGGIHLVQVIDKLF